MNTKIKNIVTAGACAAFIFGFGIWSIVQPEKTVSDTERRPLAKFPQASAESIMNGSFMSDFEKYTLDHFPLRDGFRTLKSVAALYVMGQRDNNDIYIAEGYASRLEYPLDEDSISYAAERFGFVYDKYLKDSGANVYLSVIPDKNYFLAEKHGYPALDYTELTEQMREQMSWAEYIDIFPLLELSDYYRTDTHWRQERIEDVAAALASGMGAEISGEYEKKELDKGFYGVYYGQSALPLGAEKLYYLENETLKNCTVYDYETSTEMPIYDMEKAYGADSYEMFLSGSKSLLRIDNPAAENDRTLVVFRDSFGSSLSPLLAEGYSTVYVVDIRYISPTLIGRFVDFENSDVLFIYSTLVLNNSVTIK